MTHFFSVTETEMQLLNSEQKRFDILKFARSVSVGDTVLYQLTKEDPADGEEQPDGVLPEEIPLKIDYLFEDTEGALKKGFVGVGFAMNNHQTD